MQILSTTSSPDTARREVEQPSGAPPAETCTLHSRQVHGSDAKSAARKETGMTIIDIIARLRPRARIARRPIDPSTL
ncbi:MAG TPA: hypothetical protein VFE52_02990, partial [Devosia sp.]|nr:hypothetical protein [Devosia sp.]